MLLKIIFEVVPGHCTVVLRRQLLGSFILFYLSGADCINSLIQCNTGSLKHWNFDLSSSVSFVSHCFWLYKFPIVIVVFLQLHFSVS